MVWSPHTWWPGQPAGQLWGARGGLDQWYQVSGIRSNLCDLGMEDSRNAGDHLSFWEEISNYNAMACSDMFAGKRFQYKHKQSIVLANAGPPEKIKGRRVKVLSVPGSQGQKKPLN